MATDISVYNWNEGAGRSIGQKTFVSTCHFQPKRVPVKYTETMIVHLNSPKRRYFESVAYETKMVPSHWSQTMFVDLLPGRDRIVSEVHIPCDIYVPLIPQEVITQNIADKVESVDTTQKVDAPTEKTECTQAKVPTSSKTQILGKYHKNTCEEFLNEMRKMY
ncbi:uncharacterized protein [Atheta coriaria]|uniref:uncharacterized protein n=1 Tax=Dalotia coriaria TaxID=877792 RepID=UPI0031F42B33